MPILGMGVRYYSSYDACEDCFQKIYDIRGELSQKVTQFATMGGYKLEQGESIPIYSLFYSSRPYKESSYTIRWERQQKGQRRSINLSYRFPKRQGIVKVPNYYFTLPKFSNPSNTQLFSKRSTKQLSLLRAPTELTEDQIYSYVRCFEPEGLPICYE